MAVKCRTLVASGGQRGATRRKGRRDGIMFHGWSIIAVALGYVSALFALAWIGDRALGRGHQRAGRPVIYALSLAVYCTSWTFFGSVGLAARSGYDFIPVYLGPILMFTIGWPLILRIVRVAKSQNITSVADFLSARYGKSQAVAAVVTVVAVLGMLPYVALQLKAIAVSVETMLGGSPLLSIQGPSLGYVDTALLITLVLIAFAILFGTRHIDATEHQHGLIVAIAAESLVKLAAFIAIGVFVVMSFDGGVGGMLAKAQAMPALQNVFGQGFNGGTWLTITFLSAVCVILIPRQFHVGVVESRGENEVRRASWLFPLYLVLINLFVVPLAAAGLMRLPPPVADPYFYVLTLPMFADARAMTLLAFVGGLSSATAMVIVESVALAIMICNGLVIPLLLRRNAEAPRSLGDMASLVLTIRRVAICGILLLGYFYYQALGRSEGLAAIGLISFAAIAQLAPAFFGGLMWRNATSTGAIASICAGIAVWGYTLMLPWIAKAGWMPASFIDDGPLGIALFKPQALFFLQFEPLTHGVLWSLGVNIVTYITVSLLRMPEPVERLQAHVFIQEDKSRVPAGPPFRLWRTTVTTGDLKDTVARYLGAERAERSFVEFAESRGTPFIDNHEADVQTIRFTEHLLSSAIGAASSRLVLSLLLRRGNVSGQSALKLLDDASEALQYNRDLLQSALDQVRHGLCVFDKDMRLICWNRQYRELLDLPPELGRVGVPLDRSLRVMAERGDFGIGEIDWLIADRLTKLAVTKETFQERLAGSGRVVEVRTSPMPQGGIVTTYSDITDRMAAASALAKANETLERRVHERTAELTEANAALAVAKAKADAANLDKTRFIAAASHDILQPLNAARLYATSLVEWSLPPTEARLAHNVDAALGAVEEIFSALIEISKMDAGRMEPEFSDISLGEIFSQLRLEFEPMAREKGLKLSIVDSTQWVRSDRRLLRRVLQNLVANAIKYTRTGSVLLGARRRGGNIELQVIDTGPGIPKDKQGIIFKEFQRLEGPGSNVRGVGLGLSIVERIGRILGTPITIRSEAGHGSLFSVTVEKGVARKADVSEPAAATVAGALSGCVLLCIDNEPAVLAGMEALLTGWGCRVHTAASISKSVETVAAMPAPPDVILADYHLDSGTGPLAVEAVRKALGNADIPAVIITADHGNEVQRDVKSRGLAMLRKPLKAAALRALLTQYAQRRAAAAE
jgi:Na+/proline symporter/signal transduction histidine kinase